MSLAAAYTQATRPCLKFEGHTESIEDVIHLPGGRRIMTCSSDGSLRVWNSKTGAQIGDDWRDGESGVNAIALSPDGKRIASGSEDGAVRLWNIDTGKVITKWSGHKSGIAYLCWNREGGQVVSGSWDGTTRAHDVKSRETILAINTGLDNVRAVVYSPDSTMFATSGHSEEKEFIKIWDANTGKLIANATGHTSTVTCLAWTADGRRLISGSCDRSIRIWNTSTWQQITILAEQTHTVSAIAISPNDRILASASWDDTTRLWNLGDGQLIGSPLQHANFVFCVSFSADSKLLATGCWDDNAYAWDVSAIIREVGLDELLLNPNDGNKSLLDADATRRPGQQRENARRVPPGFFDSPHHPHSSGGGPPPLPARQPYVVGHLSSHKRPLLGQVYSLLRRNNCNEHDAPSRRNDEGTELQEGRSAVLDVPFAHANPRNYSARELRKKKEKEKEKAREAKKAKRLGAYLATDLLDTPVTVGARSSIAPSRVVQVQASIEPISVQASTETIFVQTEQTFLLFGNIADRFMPLLSRIEDFVHIGHAFAEAHLYTRMAFTVLAVGYEVIRQQHTRDESIRQLASTMCDSYSLVSDATDLCRFQDQDKTVTLLARQTIECAYFIRDYALYKSGAKHAITNVFSNIDATILGYETAFIDIKAALEQKVVISTQLVVCQIHDVLNDLAAKVDLNILPYATGASYHAQRSYDDTSVKEDLLTEISDWVNDQNSSAIYLLIGPHGYEASAAAHTIARRFDAISRLGSSYCLNRTHQTQQKPNNLFSTIARDLADHDPEFMVCLGGISKRRAVGRSPHIPSQFNLILAPAQQLTNFGPVLIVIDALDACGDANSRVDVLSVLKEKAQNLPPSFKFLITCLPDTDVDTALRDSPHVLHKELDSVV